MAPAEVLQAGERRIARVESLRALAALGVVAGHVWGQGHLHDPATIFGTYPSRVIFGGGFGVYLFFALSGYLLFWPFVRSYFRDGASVDLRRYAANRVLRIVPLYVFAVVLLLLLQEDGGTGEQWWRFMTFSENFSRFTLGSVDGVLWSVVVEVHFYILLPVIAVLLAVASRRNLAVAAALLVGLGALSFHFWWHYVQPHAVAVNGTWRYNLPATFFFFVSGMLLAMLRLRVETRRPGWLDWPVIGSSGAWLAASVAVWLWIFDDYARSPWCALAAGLAVGACVLPLRETRLRRLLDWRPVVAIGVASYSLYVWHLPLQENLAKIDGFPSGTAALFAISVPLALVAAFLSYWLVETPFLRLRRRWSEASAPIEDSDAAEVPPARAA